MTNIELLRSLAKEASVLKNGGNEEEVKSTEESMNGFSLTLAEYPDIIITKRMSRITKHLIIMPSASCAFIKTDNGKDEPVSEMLTEDLYCNFTASMPDIRLPEGFWAPSIKKGKQAGCNILRMIDDKIICEMLRKKAFPATVNLLKDQGKYGESPEHPYIDAFMAYPNLYMEYLNKPKSFKLLLSEQIFCKTLIKNFGLDNMRDFLNNYEESLIVTDSGNRYRSGNETFTRGSN